MRYDRPDISRMVQIRKPEIVATLPPVSAAIDNEAGTIITTDLDAARRGDISIGHIATEGPPTDEQLLRWATDGPGWVGFVTRLTSLLLSLAPFRSEKLDRKTQKWIPDEDDAAFEVLSMIRSNFQEQSELIYDSAWLNDVTGQWHVAYSPEVLGGFLVAQKDQVKLVNDVPAPPGQGMMAVRLAPKAYRDERWRNDVRFDDYLEIPERFVQRVWVKDQRWHRWAWSPLRSIADDVRGYIRALENVDDAVASPLIGNGMIWFPESNEDLGDLMVDNGVNGEKRKANPVDRFNYIAAKNASRTDISRRGLALPAYGGTVAPRWIEVGKHVDAETLAVVKMRLEAAAMGLDYPTKLLTEGPGSGKFANEFLLEANAIRSGLEPRARRLSTQWTTYAYRPLYEAHVGADAGDRRISLDLAPVTSKPDQLRDLLYMSRLGIVKRETIIDSADLKETDMLKLPPGVTEYDHWQRSVERRTQQGAEGEPPTSKGEPQSDMTDPDDPGSVRAGFDRDGYRPKQWNEDWFDSYELLERR